MIVWPDLAIRQRKPVAMHTVAPTFPSFAHTESSRVEVSFGIAADGSLLVRDPGGQARPVLAGLVLDPA